MKNTLIYGIILAVLAGVAVWVGELLHLDLHNVVLGAGIGAVLGLIPERSPVYRLGGFLIGVVVGWAAYAVRAAFLPDNVWSVVILSGGTLLLLTLISVATGTRISLWSLLLGSVGMIGAYEYTFTEAPHQFLTQSFSAMAALLLTAGMGMLAVMIGMGFTAIRTGPPPKEDLRPMANVGAGEE